MKSKIFSSPSQFFVKLGLLSIVGFLALAASPKGAFAELELEEEGGVTCKQALEDRQANFNYCSSLIGRASLDSITNCYEVVWSFADRAHRVCGGVQSYE